MGKIGGVMRKEGEGLEMQESQMNSKVICLRLIVRITIVIVVIVTPHMI